MASGSTSKAIKKYNKDVKNGARTAWNAVGTKSKPAYADKIPF
jgi:hypothetical protein